MIDDKTLIFLDNKKIPSPVAFSVEEGWVDVWDTKELSSFDGDNNEQKSIDFTQAEPEIQEVPTKRLRGTVIAINFS
jgi:hypothetical protein